LSSCSSFIQKSHRCLAESSPKHGRQHR
jgi:hypothetical protein